LKKNPTEVRLSKHFLLSDFLGCHSVYSKGYANPFDFDAPDAEMKLENASALCEEALEPLLTEYGPLSVSYGYISPELSSRIVKYQDPGKPSHHRWDLGAAADICVHRWVEGGFQFIDDLFLPESVIGSPIGLAHAIDQLDVPYSRLITYSESPYVCLAVSARELIADDPRKAFYENRYQGVPKVKPDYRTYSTLKARNKAFELLQEKGLEHPWQGAGYPTHHGGGFRQYQHMRVSKYTMVSDWLFDLKSISKGAKNIPSLNLDSVQDAFAAAGMVYDWLIDATGVPRLSILSGYLSHTNPHLSKAHDANDDWRQGIIHFAVATPEGGSFDFHDPPGVVVHDYNGGSAIGFTIDVEHVLKEWE
jgi:hypothetical protein